MKRFLLYTAAFVLASAFLSGVVVMLDGNSIDAVLCLMGGLCASVVIACYAVKFLK